MTIDVVRGPITDHVAADALSEAASRVAGEGTLYLGYPILATADERVEIDALLVSSGFGVTAFKFDSSQPSDESFWKKLADEQDSMYVALESNLSKHESLRRGRQFLIPIRTATVSAWAPQATAVDSDANFVDPTDLERFISTGEAFDPDVYRSLESALQRVTTIRPAKKRQNLQRSDSRGATIKVIERGIANLDRWQKRAAIETPDGPQRIRGLAGSGKTIVLAMKAALLHAQHPDWNILVTFASRALYQQFEDLIRRFAFAHMDDSYDPERLHIMHSWGSRERPGVYKTLAETLDTEFLSWQKAQLKFRSGDPFASACKEVLDASDAHSLTPRYDAVLIDEAQDLPPEFFQLVHKFTKDPKRVVWAYDELQKLDDSEMADLEGLFGVDSDGSAVVSLKNQENAPRQDVILPICYRNSPWALATAHAVGFGVYRDGGLVQHFENTELWTDIGYAVVSGDLQPGEPVTLTRSTTSTPRYFQERVTPQDAVLVAPAFAESTEQDEWLAYSIQTDLREGELRADDILVVLPDAYTSKKRFSQISAALAERGVTSHLVGVGSSVDEVFVSDSVAVAHIYRAKGNEAAMVYVVDSQFANARADEVSGRNTLFTAITRSKAWVRILGWGTRYEAIAAELAQVQANNFNLSFTVPTAAELSEMRRVNRDAQAARPSLLTFDQLLAQIDAGAIEFSRLPRSVRTKLENFVRSTDE